MKSINSKVKYHFGDLSWKLGETPANSKTIDKVRRVLRGNVNLYDPWYSKTQVMDFLKLRIYAVESILEAFPSYIKITYIGHNSIYWKKLLKKGRPPGNYLYQDYRPKLGRPYRSKRK